MASCWLIGLRVGRRGGKKEGGKEGWNVVAFVFIIFVYHVYRNGNHDLEGKEIGIERPRCRQRESERRER